MKTLMTTSTPSAPVISPFPRFAALDGCHCITSSLARIFHHAGHPLPEEMLLGLGAGMGFVYWRMKFGDDDSVFIGGRSNLKNFYHDLASRTGVVIREKQTSSAAKAEAELLRSLAQQRPVMLGGDMGLLPWFDLPGDYHFGGHTFVACGFDGRNTVLCSDIEQKSPGVKKGFFAPASLPQLRKARSSPFKPFPPKNLWFEFDFSAFREPRKQDILDSIRQTIDAELHPPIKNFGIRGMRHTAAELLRWPGQFNDRVLRMTLFNLYIFIEVGGTGGGCFRPMYARFLKQAAEITRNQALLDAAEHFHRIGEGFSHIGLMFKDVAHVKNLNDRITTASHRFREVADQEEQAWHFLEARL
jgi:hypothetical protein